MAVVAGYTASNMRPNIYRWSRLLPLALIGCCLMVVMTLKPRDTVLQRAPAPRDMVLEPTLPGDDDGGGLLGGRPISELSVASRPEHAWFTNDSQCRPLVTRFACDHCVPLVYLASFPRSGNTWTRYLLEASTGLFTVSGGPLRKVYINRKNDYVFKEDQIWRAARAKTELVQLGYLGENIPWTQGVGIVAKTHALPEPWNATEADIMKQLSPFPENSTRRAVLIIRDPFKSLISLQKYAATKSVLNPEDMTYLYRGEQWQNYVMDYSRIWYDMNARWLESTNETHVIAYERLTRDPIGELTSLFRFLDMEPDQRRMKCLRNHLEGKAHNRKHGIMPDHETYPLRQRVELWSHIHQLNWLLKDKGYPTLPLERYSFADEFRDINMPMS